jgi:hypothetical protein
MRLYDSIQQGFEAVASQFNGLSELLNRKDAGTELLAIYSKMNPQDIEDNWGDLQRGIYAFSIAKVEILLTQNEILDDLTEIQLENLILEARLKYTAKEQSAIYGQTGLDSTQQLIERVSQRHYTMREYNSYVLTPKGTQVAVIVDQTEMSPGDIDWYNWYVAYYFPYAIRLTNATNKYNCHSYAWYNQTTSNNAWMPNPSAYWTDGSYARWTGAPYVGLKVRYVVGNAHSAIIYNISNHQYKSKWGPGPLMIHSPSYCPYIATTLYYYYRVYY